MIAVGKGDDVGAALDHPGQLESGFHGVGAGGPGELNLVLVVAGSEDGVAELLQKGPLGGGGLVQPVNDTVALQIGDHRLGDLGVIVAVVEHAGAGEEVQVAVAAFVEHFRAFRGVEHRGEGADVAADFGFHFFKNAHRRFLVVHSLSRG